MKVNSQSECTAGGIAFLWDESFLWGVMAYRALRDAGLAFELVRAADIRHGCLDRFRALFVPGGWASNKIKALGEDGVEVIRQFVRAGGTYIGFCGGAGLATKDGIGLLPVKRRPTRDRVPSFSGPIRLRRENHALWEGTETPVFQAWWPSQFLVEGEAQVLATYAEALPDSFSSDVNVGDAEAAGAWSSLEGQYGINLDPARLYGEPAVIEGAFGKGRVFLSLVHFDTPEDANGARVLKNVWRYAGAGRNAVSGAAAAQTGLAPSRTGAASIDVLAESVDGLIELGARNFLWFPRNRFLLQWRRGVRGLEYCTLSVMVHEIRRLIDRLGAPGDLDALLGSAGETARSFCERARELLVRERFVMQRSPITYDRCDDERIQELRNTLFSRAKSHGGVFKELADGLDAVLYRLLQEEVGARPCGTSR